MTATTVSLQVTGDEGPMATRSLLDWLRREPDVAHARLLPVAPRPEHLGAISDLVTVVLGTAGGGSALAGALTVWLQTRTRETRVAVTVERDGQMWTFEVASLRKASPERVTELTEHLEQALRRRAVE